MAGLLANEESLRLVIFGGKGGAGKTTSAAATAIHLARRRPRRRILLVSTDPAHSLADSLDVFVTDDPVAVPGTDNLWVRQLDAPQADRRFHMQYDRVLKALIDRGTFLDDEDAQNIVDLPLPGLDEIIAVRELANLLKENTYQLIIMDTAPTGHTLRLLALPEVMESWVHAYSLMQRKHKYMQRTFAGRCTPDAVDAFLKTLRADVCRVRDLLHNSASTEFVPVANADPLSVAETRRLVDTLANMRIAVRSLVINRVPADRDCPFCRARHVEAVSWLDRIGQDFEPFNLVRVPLLAGQVRGVGKLERFGAAVFGAEAAGAPTEDTPAIDVGKSLRHRQTPLAELLHRNCKFILFGGKGGVGKTSLAAAMALKIAAQRPKDRVLVLSIDPAHSLSDCLDCSVGNQAVRINAPGLLEAKELNAEDLFKAYIDEYRRDIARAFDIAGNVELRFDREVMDELLSVWPSGLDEIMALVEMLDLSDAYDVVVLDTAPTGHLLRFLEMPELARQWLKAIFRIIIKHQTVINLTNIGEKLVQLSRDIRRVQEALINADQTTFVAVTIPETMAVAETHRLLASLKRLGVSCRDLVINMVTSSPASCPFCRARRREEQSCIRELRGPADVAITEVPLLAQQIRGIGALNDLIAAALGPAGSWIQRVLNVSPKLFAPLGRLMSVAVANPAPGETCTCRRRD
ncbi:MAG: ArsA family ATPase [Phycisphaerae bacterium]|nr:ArsA family ATPase [Phycisphaerae bacterium]